MISHINIGSNLGNRAAMIDRAVALLSELGNVLAVSTPVYSPAWGYDSANEFMNVGVNLESNLFCWQILPALQEIERKLVPDDRHRTADGEYADRAIDIDLIAWGREWIDTEDLVVPHPRMHLRRFVLEPMAEIWGDWRHPLTRQTPAEMLALIQ